MPGESSRLKKAKLGAQKYLLGSINWLTPSGLVGLVFGGCAPCLEFDFMLGRHKNIKTLRLSLENIKGTTGIKQVLCIAMWYVTYF